MLALTLDIMIVLLLLISLGAGIRLYGALKVFRIDSSEFQPMVTSLDRATSKAEFALSGLRKMAEDVGTKLNDEAKSTQRLLDELDFMTKRADQLAERLDERIGKARSADMRSEEKPPQRAVAAGETKGSSSPGRRRASNLEQRLKSLR